MEHGVAVYAAVYAAMYAAVQCGNRNMPHPMLDCGLDDPRTGRKMTEVSSRNRWMSHDVTVCHMSDVKVRVSFSFFFQIAQEGCEGRCCSHLIRVTWEEKNQSLALSVRRFAAGC